MYTFVLILQIATVVISFINIFLVTSIKSFPGYKTLIVATISVFIHCLGFLLEVTAKDLSTALAATKIQYIGGGYTVILMMLFIYQYCHLRYRRAPFVVMFIVNTAVFSLVLTAEYHDLYYADLHFVNEGLYPHMMFHQTLIYSVYMALLMVGSLYTLFVAGMYCYKNRTKKNRIIILLAVAVALPVIVKIMFVTGIFQFYDLTPNALMISCIILIFVVSRDNFSEVARAGKENFLRDIDEAIIIVTNENCYVDSNAAARKLFPDLETAKEGQNIESISFFVYRLLVNKTTTEFKLGDAYYESRVTEIVHGNTLQGYTVCIFDVTQARINLNNLVALKDKAESAAQTKAMFLANMSHEIRTPMNAICGMSDLLLSTPLTKEGAEYAGVVKDSAENLLGIINDILDFSKIESGKLEIAEERYKFADVLFSVSAIVMTKLADKPVKFLTDIDLNIPSGLIGDEMRLRQILINLLTNAAKFTPEGEITLKVEWEKTDENNGILKACVTDTGIGITPEDQKKLFQDFTQVDMLNNRKRGGTGLGLSISRNLLHLMNGEITVESVYGKGSSFSFTLPQKVYDNTAVDISHDSYASSKKDNVLNTFIAPEARFLVVDDNPVNLKVAEGLLKLYKGTIELAESGKAAITMIKSGRSYDVIFMDHMMPEMDGIETVKRIQRLPEYDPKKTKIVALTANALKGIEDMFRENGFDEYVSKPIKMERLDTVLHALLPANKLASPTVSEPEKKEIAVSPVKELKCADTTIGMNNCLNKPEIYLKQLKTFAESSRSVPERLNAALDKSDVNEFTAILQPLRAAALNIGAKRISNAIATLLTLTKSADISALKLGTKILVQAITEADAEISEIDK